MGNSTYKRNNATQGTFCVLSRCSFRSELLRPTSFLSSAKYVICPRVVRWLHLRPIHYDPSISPPQASAWRMGPGMSGKRIYACGSRNNSLWIFEYAFFPPPPAPALLIVWSLKLLQYPSSCPSCQLVNLGCSDEIALLIIMGDY